MADLPAGTVTFLFTDIEGSTRLLKQLRDGYALALADHQRILRASFGQHQGHEIDTQGDSFFFVFTRADDAVAGAIDAQRALGGHTWPDGTQVRVRMGLHSGEPRTSGERYVGFGVHRAARVGAAAHGGQIVVSNSTRELVEDELPAGTRLRDLGFYRLKDVDRPENLFQVEAEGLPREFPALGAPRVGGPRRGRRLLVVAGAVAVAVAAAVAVGVAVYANATAGPAVGSAAKPITIVTTWAAREPERHALNEVLRTFEETTGLQTKVTQFNVSDSSEIGRSLEARPAMVAVVPSPGVLANLARAGVAKPLAALEITDDSLRRNYGKTWLDLATVDGETYGFPVKTNSKSLVWYRPDEFARLRLTVPKTWQELISVMTKVKEAGEKPWALSADAPWTLTDWFENIYVRTAGPWRYDALFAGKLPFDDASVLASLRRMSAILGDANVAGGTTGALNTDFPEALRYVFGRNHRAHLFMEGGFVGPLVVAVIKPTPKPGRTIAAMPLPPADARVSSPVVVGADFVVPLSDDKAIGKLLLYLSSPGAGRIWVSTGAVVSPNKGIALATYPNTLALAEARQLTAAQVVRFDGSDLLPAPLGADLGETLREVIRRPAQMSQLMAAFQRKATRVFEAD